MVTGHDHPLVLLVNLEGRHTLTFDLRDWPLPRLTRQLADVLRAATRADGVLKTNETTASWVYTAGRFVRWRAARGMRSAQQGGLRDLGVESLECGDIDEWEISLTERIAPSTAYAYATTFLKLLRLSDEESPGLLSQELRERVMAGSYIEPGRTGTPRDAYSAGQAARLRGACRTDTKAAVRRQEQGGAALRRAREDADPTPMDKLVQRIYERGPLERKAFAKAARELGLQNRPGLMLEAHGLVFPSLHDLFPFAVALGLQAGLPPESIRDLRDDCLKNPTPDFVHVEYLKRRGGADAIKRKRVRDGGPSTPGGIVRTVLTLTRRARELHGGHHLWLCYGQGRLYESFFSNWANQEFMRRHGLVDDAGEDWVPQLARLRKTRKADHYRATGGRIDEVADDHSPRVAAKHYFDVPALRPTHEQAVENGMRRALLTVLSPDVEQACRQDPAAAAEVLGAPAEVAEEVVAGERDLWLASCTDIYNSPWDPAGQACSRPYACLECGNAVVTVSRLPAILLFLEHMLRQRRGMDLREWESIFGRAYRRIVQQVLPAFTDDDKAQAKAIAASVGPLELLPPFLATNLET